MSLARLAKAAYRSGDYQQAVDLYQRAISEQPELANFYLFTLNIARSKLNQARPHIMQTMLSSGDQNFDLKEATTNHPLVIDQLSHQIESSAALAAARHTNDSSLVSVLMITHNDANYIEESVVSILRQSWTNIEIIVIDRFSSDRTWAILQRLQRSVGNLHCHQLSSPLTPLFARNYALQLAKGEFIFYQNSIDLCHQDRIRLSMAQLILPSVCAVRAACAQVIFPSGEVIPFNGAPTQPSLMTLGLRRQSFDKIKLLDYNSKLSDEEFYQRLNHWAVQHGEEIRELDLPVYFKNVCEASPFTANNRARAASPSIENEGNVGAFSCIHQQLGIEQTRESYRSPIIHALMPVERDTSSLSKASLPVVVSLCSIPERAELLRQTLASLTSQVDTVYIYLDRYEAVPDFVQNCHARVQIYLSKDHPGLRDNGKFLAFAALAEDCYYFTADDDIIYPPDYVASMVRRIEDYERQAVIGVHGVLLPEQAEGYFTSYRKVHMFKKELERDALVNNLGTGTVAFHSGLLRGMDLTHFGTPGMADLHLSVFCKQHNIPMVAIARPEDWLQELPSPNTSLYNEFRQTDDQQSALVRAHKPWGYAAISQAVEGASMRAASPEAGERLRRLIPILHACLK